VRPLCSGSTGSGNRHLARPARVDRQGLGTVRDHDIDGRTREHRAESPYRVTRISPRFGCRNPSVGCRDSVGTATVTSTLLDSRGFRVDTHLVGVLPNRLNIPDARGHGASLQVTSHSEQHKVVLSHWRDGTCVASTPVDLTELPALIGVLVDALGHAVAAPSPALECVPNPSLWHRLTARFRPTVGTVVELPHRHVHDAGRGYPHPTSRT
jgi:hypothetical protein